MKDLITITTDQFIGRHPGCNDGLLINLKNAILKVENHYRIIDRVKNKLPIHKTPKITYIRKISVYFLPTFY